MASFKRARSPRTHDLSPSASPPDSPTLKALRTSATPPPHSPASTYSPGPSHSGILCSLPPTCHPPNRPTSLAGTRELEQHYAMYHAHVCEEIACGSVFPDARLLELHQTECHDPIAAVRQERGEKIFACFVATCPRFFSSPKRRRQHLIQVHGYPKEYFFAVTNKGVGELLKKWGEGASMLRGSWKPREERSESLGDDEHRDGDGDDDNDVSAMDAEHEGAQNAPRVQQQGVDSDEDEILLGKIQIERPARAHANASRAHEHSDTARPSGAAPDADADALAGALGSLSLVPSTIQFGRGAKRGARGHQPRRGGDRHVQGVPGATQAGMDVDHVAHPHPPVPGRGAARGGGPGHSSGAPWRGGAPPIPPRGAAVRGMIGRGRGRGRGRGGFGVRGGMVLGRGVGGGAPN